MTRRHRPLAAGALALGLLAAQPAAHAAVVQVLRNQPLAAGPATISLGTATFAFTRDDTGFAPAADVATGGSGMVATLFGLTDFESGATIADDPANLLFRFAAYPAATPIPNSQADDFVGLSYAAADGTTHYGYAEVFGPQLVGYAYETTPGAAIQTAAVAASPVPEPASAAMLLAGVGALALRRRARRAKAMPAA